MGFIIAAACMEIIAIVFAVQGGYEAFGGGTVIAVVLLICWVLKRKKGKGQPAASQQPNNGKEIPVTVYPPTTPIVSPFSSVEVPSEKNIQTEIHSDIQKQCKSENHYVAGTLYHQNEIESLGEENPMYACSKKELIDKGCEDEKIYYYLFFPKTVDLVEDPENEFDPNAIKVVVDSVHIGYIKKGSCARVKKLLHSGNITKIEAEIGGGKYKCLYCDFDEEQDKNIYTLENEESDYFAKVTIKYFEE